MTPKDVFDHWTHQRYMNALEAAWHLRDLYNYPTVKREAINLTVRELVFRACRDAVDAAYQGRREEVERWLESLLGKFPPPPALINHDEVDLSDQERLDRETFRTRTILAHLRCVEVAIKRDWDWTSRTMHPAGLDQVAEETEVPMGFLRDLVEELLPAVDGEGRPRPPVATCTLSVLLVDTAHDVGVVADLTLERLPEGTGSLYPTPELGFVYREADWCRAERQASAYVQRAVSPPVWDVRWRLVRHDQQPLPAILQGESLGAALALGLTKLAGGLQDLSLEGISITAAIDEHGTLSPVGGLWEKLGQRTIDLAQRGLLNTVVVAIRQPGVPAAYVRDDAAPLRVVKATSLLDAVDQLYKQSPQYAVWRYERQQCGSLEILDKVVPIEAHYQALPLLRRVPRERLPRDSHDPGTNDSARPQETEERELREVDIVRWEERALQEERYSYEQHTLEEVIAEFRHITEKAQSDVPRFVVLGPPGSGKTTLTQYLAWKAAHDVRLLSDRPLVPARVRLRDWEHWALRASNFGLGEYLATRYAESGISPAPAAEQWHQWLRHGEVLLLLDGLDEITGHNTSFTAALKTVLTTFPTCPTVLTCRTVSFEQHATLCPDLPIFLLAGLEETQCDTYIRAFPAEHHDRYDAEALITQLAHAPQMRPLTANPLLLSIICYMVDDPQGVTLPATRTALYTKAVEKLLARSRRVDIAYPAAEPDAEGKRLILERVALNLFAKETRTLTFTARELGRELRRVLGEEDYGTASAPWANALRDDLTHNSGILRGNPDQGYFFLHLTIHEFLAAAALARLVREQGWQAQIGLAGTGVLVRNLVDSKAWDPRWQEIITLFAGQLHDPTQLLQSLADATRDDLFRHRLALAVLCLPEIQVAIRSAIATIVDNITSAAFSFWRDHNVYLHLPHSHYTTDAVSHLTRVIPALGYMNARIFDTERNLGMGAILNPDVADKGNCIPLLEWLQQRLSEQIALGPYNALGVVKALGAPAATPAVLAHLSDLLGHPRPWVRQHAVEALKAIGRAAATPDFLARLADLLQDSDRWVRQDALRAVSALGCAAATPTILTRLADLLLYPDRWVREDAVRAVKALGRAVVTQDFLSCLADLLEAPMPAVRRDAVRAVKAVGGAAATPTILARLADLLQGPEQYMRGDVVQALISLGSAAATPVLLACLVTLLREKGPGAREADTLLAKLIEQGGRIFDQKHQGLVVQSVRELTGQLK